MHVLTRSRVTARLTVFAALLLTSCVSNPYALRISDVDESGPQRNAVILVSDPQIYARESLINDRRREAAYLEEQLKLSETAVFTPQINRELRAISSVGLSFSGGFDPASGRQYRDQTEDRAFADEITEAQREIQLLQLEQQLQALKNKDASDFGEPAPTNEQIAALEKRIEDQNSKISTLEGKIGTLEGDESRRTLLEDLRARRDDDSKRLERQLPAAGQVATSGIIPDPRDLFRDRQSFRNELRAALAEAQLDDAHDLNGNALYRLQLRTTVLPGDKKAKYGVARFTVNPPELTAEDLTTLYRTWLGHLNYRAHQAAASILRNSEQVAPQQPAFVAYSGGAVGRGYSIYTLGLEKEVASAGGIEDLNRKIQNSLQRNPPPRPNGLDGGGTENSNNVSSANSISVALPSGLDESLILNFLSRDDYNSAIDYINEYRLALQEARAVSCTTAPELRKRFLTKIEPTPLVYDYVFSALINAQQAYNQERTQFSALDRLVIRVTVDGQRRVESLSNAIETINRWPRAEGGQLRDCNDYNVPYEFVSSDFRRGLNVTDVSNNQSRFRLDSSRTYAFATSPIETVQQVSSLASALSTFEAGLALNGSLPQSGTSLGGAANFANAAQGRISALERQPTVVGFSDRAVVTETGCEGESACVASADGDASAIKTGQASRPAQKPVKTEQMAQFGWVFGPKVTVDARRKRLLLEHVPKTYQSTADIAVPGWWPFLELETETAWIEKWKHGIDPLKTENTTSEQIGRETFRVELPLNRSDLDAITEAIAKKYSGRSIPFTQLLDVQPRYVSACETEVTFLLSGTNLWRATEVFLNGRRHSQIRVMPDMTGLTATFNIENLPILQHPDGSLSNAKLQVWTRDGASKAADITLSSARADGRKCFERTGSATPLNIDVSPNTKHFTLGASNLVRLAVTRGNLPASYHSLFVDFRERRANAFDFTKPAAGAVFTGSAFSQTYPKSELDSALSSLASSSVGAVEMELRLRLVPRPGAQPIFSTIADRVIVYRDTAASRPSVPASTSIARLDQPFEISLPAFFSTAYSELLGGGEVRAQYGTGANKVAVTGTFRVDSSQTKAIITFAQNAAITKSGDITVQAIGPIGSELPMNAASKVQLAITP